MSEGKKNREVRYPTREEGGRGGGGGRGGIGVSSWNLEKKKRKKKRRFRFSEHATQWGCPAKEGPTISK